MARRGPKPKPTILKILEGNPGRRPLNTAEPKPPSGLPPCPAALTGRSRELWDQIGTPLAECGILTQIDGLALEQLIAAYVEWCEAAVNMAKGGPIWFSKTATEGGLPSWKYSPYWHQAAKASRMVVTLLREFGMTPSSRSLIKASKPVEKPEAEDLSARYFG